jgi:excisionase family DNA binding protein
MNDNDFEHGYWRPYDLEGLLHIGRSSVYSRIRSGEIPSVRLGKCILIPKDTLKEALAARVIGNVISFEPSSKDKRW